MVGCLFPQKAGQVPVLALEFLLRGASKPEAVALAGAETRGKAEKRAVGWAGGAEWGTFRIFPFG